MGKEPKELIEARNLLSKFEKNINQSDSIFLLPDALDLLEEIIASVAPKPFKDTATNLRKTYASKIFQQANIVLSATDILETEQIKHWGDMMGHFGDNVSQEFSLLREKINKEYILRLLRGLSKYQLQQLLKECEEEEKLERK